ncbi:hypothetical protein BKA57DRAFT_503071 [Linnemannia elongata]|nr:hypothetical protein BKA57DRAFT_503071 [Linnemannia elongata]
MPPKQKASEYSSAIVIPSSSPSWKPPSVDSTLTLTASTTPVNVITTSAAPASPPTHMSLARPKKDLKPTALSTPPTSSTTVSTTNSDLPSTPLEQPVSLRILLNPPPTRSQVRNRRQQSTRDKSSTTTTINRASLSSSTFANGSEKVVVKQGMSYPNPRNHPALRRILGEEVPHLFPPPPRSVSGVGGWGKEGQDENEGNGDDDEYDEGIEDHKASSISASVTLSASNLTFATYTLYLPPGVDPAYPHGFSRFISIPTPSTTTAATSTTTADASEATPDGAVSTNSTSTTYPSSRIATGTLTKYTLVESPSAAHLRQTRSTTVVGSGSCSGTIAVFMAPSVTLPVLAQVEPRADQCRHAVLREIEVLLVVRGESEFSALLQPLPSPQTCVIARGHRLTQCSGRSRDDVGRTSMGSFF